MGGEISSEDKNVLKISKICEPFFWEPTLEQFSKIRDQDLLETAFSVFKLAVRSKWGFGKPLTNSETLFLDLQKRLIMNPNRVLTTEDLDCLWCLFYATGEKEYEERIKSVFEGKDTSNPLVKLAFLSYQNYTTKGYKYLDQQ